MTKPMEMAMMLTKITPRTMTMVTIARPTDHPTNQTTHIDDYGTQHPDDEESGDTRLIQPIDTPTDQCDDDADGTD